MVASQSLSGVSLLFLFPLLLARKSPGNKSSGVIFVKLKRGTGPMHFQGKLCWFLEQDSRELNERKPGTFSPLCPCLFYLILYSRSLAQNVYKIHLIPRGTSTDGKSPCWAACHSQHQQIIFQKRIYGRNVSESGLILTCRMNIPDMQTLCSKIIQKRSFKKHTAFAGI